MQDGGRETGEEESRWWIMQFPLWPIGDSIILAPWGMNFVAQGEDTRCS